MKRILVPNLLIIALLITSNLALAEIVSFKDKDKTWKYDLSNVLGWKLYIEESVSKQKDLDKIIESKLYSNTNFPGKVQTFKNMNESIKSVNIRYYNQN